MSPPRITKPSRHFPCIIRASGVSLMKDKKTVLLRQNQKGIINQGDICVFGGDALMYIVEATAVNADIHQDLDDLYKTRSRTFSEYAKKSDLINHPLIVCGSLRHEEYSRKALGILQYAVKTRSRNISAAIDKIIQKGWPRPYYNVFNYRKVNIAAYIKELKAGYSQNAYKSFLELFIFYSLCVNNKLPIVNPAEIFRYYTTLALRSYIHSNSKIFDAYGEKDEPARREADRLKERIYSDYGIDISPDNQIRISDKELSKHFRFFYRLAYTEKIEIYYLLREIDFSEKDIREVLCAYIDVFKPGGNDEAARLFISGVIAKMLVKAVIQAKRYFFQHTENQADSEQLEKTIAGLTNENQRLASENGRLKETISGLTEKLNCAKAEASMPHVDKIRELEKQVERQNEMIRQEREKEQELVALRDFFFSVKNREVAQSAEHGQEVIMDLSSTAGAVIGGNSRWIARMKELLPKWVFISSEGFDKRSLDGIQTICFLPNNMSHTLYYKAVAIAKAKNMDIGFIYSQNEHLAMKEIAKVLVRAQG